MMRPTTGPLLYTTSRPAIIWRAVFHVACIPRAAPCTASFRALPVVWTVLYLPLVPAQLAIARALHNTTSSRVLARVFTPFYAPLSA
jgi:hypothetical protein